MTDTLMNDHIAITNRDAIKLKFVQRSGRKLFCWLHERNGLWDECHARFLDVVDFTQEELELAGIWSDLKKDYREAVIHFGEQKQAEVSDKMAEIRKKKKKKYDFSKLPEFLKCKCGRETKANYYYLQKKADQKKIPLDDLVKGYQCQTCRPTKGNKGNKK